MLTKTVEKTMMQPYPGVRLFLGTFVTVYYHSLCKHVSKYLVEIKGISCESTLEFIL